MIADTARGPHHLDGEIWPCRVRVAPEDVTLVRLQSCFRLFVFKQPRADRGKLDASLEAPHFHQPSNTCLDRFVMSRSSHDLELPLQVSKSRYRTVSPGLEHA